ncbi:amino acid permease [Hujiaoplasma nucleasis]|uniref:Amino acid permease n=1 Tax=Hujiaoplasma nucleasis TaxID=2725268 RepID=A0A7L6N2Z7_9MOLU|nr:amino acid permease [Hujiaoplasma nucleasis]QLY40640.1 amino acid permease [Hujiaoplasma nucleasis]
MDKEKQSLDRSIGLFGGISILTGIMVGSGIFFIGSYVLMRTDYSSGTSLLVWLIGGLITLIYGLIYGELGAMMPKAGGYYVYLREAFGKPVAFLSGFVNFILASSGSIAALAIAFSLILSNVLSMLFSITMSSLVMSLISVIMIILLSLLNFFEIRLGALVQKIFFVIKIIPIFLIIILGLILGTNSVSLSIDFNQMPFFDVLTMIGYAVIATFWAYEGWTNLNSVAGEVKKPGRNIPLSLIISIGSVTLLYVIYQYSTFRVLSLADLQALIQGDNIYTGINAAYVLIGNIGMYLVMITMLLSVLGALNGSIMVFPRVYYAMSHDGVLFPKFKELHSKYKTPYYAIIGSAIMAVILLVFGLDDLISLIAFSGLLFNGLIFISLFIFRKKYPNIERPYKVPFYPYLPALAIIVTGLLLVAVYVENIRSSLIGTGVLLLGLPIYYGIKYFNKTKSQ